MNMVGRSTLDMSDKPVFFDEENPEWTKQDFHQAKRGGDVPDWVRNAFPRTRGPQVGDQSAYDAAMARLESGEDELVPADAVARILAGESRVRVWRDLRGLTQAQLAEASGINRVQIADIEAGGKTGSVATLKKLASALGVGLDDLV